MWLKDCMHDRYYNTDDLTYIEVAEIDAQGASPKYYSVRGAIKGKREFVRFRKFKKEKEARDALEAIIGWINRG